MNDRRTQTIFYCDHHDIPLPPGHKFPAAKYRMLRDRLQSTGGFLLEASPLAEPGEIAGVHNPAYVNEFVKGTLDPQVMRRIGFPWSEALVRRTLASVGGTLSATERALSTGWGGTLAGGTHHAFREAGAGFCVFNDIAVAVFRARRHGVQRIAVLDLDVHQGDGTACMLENDSDVLTISVHGGNNFRFASSRATSTLPYLTEPGIAITWRRFRSFCRK